MDYTTSCFRFVNPNYDRLNPVACSIWCLCYACDEQDAKAPELPFVGTTRIALQYVPLCQGLASMCTLL